MSRIALSVGIDHYPDTPLNGCIADAKAMAELLTANEDQSPNFQPRTLISSHTEITRASLRRSIRDLFEKSDAELAVLYFAGHGLLDSDGRAILVTPDSTHGDEGVSMIDVIGWANRSKATERIIILDCCHAGAIDQFFGSASNIALFPGVSILAACRDTEFASESDGRGLFTSLVCNALEGGAADVTGAVSVASVYAYVDEVLTGWDQRPLFKANVSKLTPIRMAGAAVDATKLRKLTEYFESPIDEFRLDPSFEPEAKPSNEEHEQMFSILQQFRAARLLRPVGVPHMYHAAMQSKSCELTPLGQFYWHRVKNGKI